MISATITETTCHVNNGLLDGSVFVTSFFLIALDVHQAHSLLITQDFQIWHSSGLAPHRASQLLPVLTMAPSDNDSVVSDGQMSDLSDDSVAELVGAPPQLPPPSSTEYIPMLLEVRRIFIDFDYMLTWLWKTLIHRPYERLKFTTSSS